LILWQELKLSSSVFGADLCCGLYALEYSFKIQSGQPCNCFWLYDPGLWSFAVSRFFRGKQPGFIMECTGSADFGKSWNFCCKYIGKAGKKRRNGRKINLEEIINITENKKKYLELLLLGDEKEEMIDRYLERGDMYVLKTPLGMALCVVTDEGDGVLELKNIAVEPVCQKKGYGRRLIRFICQKYKNQFHTLQAGTGDSPLTVPFYEHCGFIRGSVIPHFFMDHYDHPIYEGGKQLDDMIYFQLKL
jgi:GNAT superfamily N-acetyltransferase